MKHYEINHCSDECLVSDIQSSKSLDETEGAESWKEESDPWK